MRDTFRELYHDSLDRIDELEEKYADLEERCKTLYKYNQQKKDDNWCLRAENKRLRKEVQELTTLLYFGLQGGKK